MSLFQSNFRKQIRKLPKFLKSVKIIHYFMIIIHYISILFIRVLRHEADPEAEVQGHLQEDWLHGRYGPVVQGAQRHRERNDSVGGGGRSVAKKDLTLG